MHKMILGQRRSKAHVRIVKAAKALAEEFPSAKSAAELLEKVFDKDPQLKELYEDEALADLLEAILKELQEEEEPPAPPAKPAAKAK